MHFVSRRYAKDLIRLPSRIPHHDFRPTVAIDVSQSHGSFGSLEVNFYYDKAIQEEEPLLVEKLNKRQIKNLNRIT